MNTKLAIHSSNGYIDLTRYLDVEPGKGMEPGDPKFTEKIFAHSLLKVGGTLALESLKLKEQVFPLKLNSDPGLRQNLIYDPSYEYDLVGEDPVEWVQILGTEVTGEVFAVSETWSGPNGDKALHVKGKHAANTTSTILSARIFNTGSASTTHLIPVVPGETIALQARLNIISAAAQGFCFKIIWLKANASTTVSTVALPTFFSGETGERVLESTTAAAPAEAAFLQIEVQATSNVSGATWEWYQDEVIAERGTVIVSYFDGDISKFRWAGTAGDSISTNYVGKKGLAELLQRINTLINTSGAQAEWIDEGADKATYFDLTSGQFDDEFDYRLGEHNWLEGKLRLFTQPLGYFSRGGARALGVQGAATTIQAGTAPVIVFQASGLLAGDAPALLQAQINASMPIEPPGAFGYAACAILPSPSYAPFVPCASFAVGGLGTLLSSSHAPGGTACQFKWASLGRGAQIGRFSASATKFSYVGPQRVLLAANTPEDTSIRPMSVSLFGPAEELIATATVSATTSWLFYDMGVVNAPSALLGAAGLPFTLNLRTESTVQPSGLIEVGGIVMLPDNATCWLSASAAGNPRYGVAFDGVSNNVFLNIDIGVPASGAGASVIPEAQAFRVMTGYVRGRVPEVVPGATSPIIALLTAIPNRMNFAAFAHANVLERTRYAF